MRANFPELNDVNTIGNKLKNLLVSEPIFIGSVCRFSVTSRDR